MPKYPYVQIHSFQLKLAMGAYTFMLIMVVILDWGHKTNNDNNLVFTKKGFYLNFMGILII